MAAKEETTAGKKRNRDEDGDVPEAKAAKEEPAKVEGEGVEKDAPPSAEDDAEGSAKAKPSTDEKKDETVPASSRPMFVPMCLKKT